MNWWDLAGATLLASTMETGFGRSPKHAHCRACAPRHDFGQRQKAMPPPGGRGPLLKKRISPQPLPIRGTPFGRSPPETLCPRNQNAFQAVYTRKKAPV